MARLPQPGSDEGNWGDILNEYLSQSHASDGKLKDDSVTANTIAPGAVTKATVGLGNVDNTADTDKPISTAQQSALDLKANTTDLDAKTATHIQDSASETAGALTATYEEQLETPGTPAREAVQEVSSKTLFYDDFTAKTVGEIMTGDLTDSGHPYGVRLGGTVGNPGTPPVVQSSGDGYNYLTHVRDDLTRTQSFYLCSGQLGPSGALASTVGAEFIIPSGVNPAEQLVLIISKEDWVSDASNGDPRSSAAAHFTFNEGGIDFDTYDGPSTLDTIAEYQANPFERDKIQRIEIHIRDGRAAVTLPNGQVLLTPETVKFDSQRGPFVTIQLYGGAQAETQIRVLRWWADTEERTGLDNRAVQLWDLARAAQVVPGQLLAEKRSNGSGVTTAIAGTLTALTAMQVTGIIVPWTKKIRVHGMLHIQQNVPSVQVALPFLYVQCDVIGASAPGKQTLVYGSKTPYNGSGSDYTESRLMPFEVEIDLSAFKQGHSVTVNVKAAGTAGMFSFMDYGDASGSASTLRQSTAHVYCGLPA